MNEKMSLNDVVHRILEEVFWEVFWEVYTFQTYLY
jgi:hypothetical protein